MRCMLLVLDSVGIGELPDADLYNDEGSNTLANTAKAVGGLNLPTFQKLGLGNIYPIEGVKSVSSPLASFGKCTEVSAGKDTMTGHWEMMGVNTVKAFPVYLNGFSVKMISDFEAKINKKIIGNTAASGTEIIKELGQKHVETGSPIIYTSADSVFQIAAHEEIISLDKLYEICEIAAKMFFKDNQIARVIARPFLGDKNHFYRTENRRDFTITPPQNILDELTENNIEVVGIGKIADIFAKRGITKEVHAHGINEIISKTFEEFDLMKEGLVFSNVVDFDMLWGHRNDPKGYAECLKVLDDLLSKQLSVFGKDDILIITADHGCDPTTKSTDHSREYIPLLVFVNNAKKPVDLGVRETFADIGQTIAHFFKIENSRIGKSFLDDI